MSMLTLMVLIPFQVNAKNDLIIVPDYYVEPVQMLTTAYLDAGKTASGEYTRPGICAGKREWIGKTAILYERNPDNTIGDMLGIFEVLDTGFGADSDGNGVGSIEEGKVIDVWFGTYEECKDWMRKTNGKCYMQLFDAAG